MRYDSLVNNVQASDEWPDENKYGSGSNQAYASDTY